MLRDNQQLEKLENALGYPFRDRSLLQLALTHTSYANEHRKENVMHNERLEFLGDAVLETVVTAFLYEQFPDLQEGDLSRLRASLVCEPTLAGFARKFGLEEFLILGKGEEMTGGRNRDSIISDAVEALIGATYLDAGFALASTLIHRHILDQIDKSTLFVDSKSHLQEMTQSVQKTLDYVLLKEEGPDHAKSFTVAAVIDGKNAGIGKGRTKKTAEQRAAQEAIIKLKGTAD